MELSDVIATAAFPNGTHSFTTDTRAYATGHFIHERPLLEVGQQILEVLAGADLESLRQDAFIAFFDTDYTYLCGLNIPRPGVESVPTYWRLSKDTPLEKILPESVPQDVKQVMDCDKTRRDKVNNGQVWLQALPKGLRTQAISLIPTSQIRHLGSDGKRRGRSM